MSPINFIVKKKQKWLFACIETRHKISKENNKWIVLITLYVFLSFRHCTIDKEERSFLSSLLLFFSHSFSPIIISLGLCIDEEERRRKKKREKWVQVYSKIIEYLTGRICAFVLAHLIIGQHFLLLFVVVSTLLHQTSSALLSLSLSTKTIHSSLLFNFH